MSPEEKSLLYAIIITVGGMGLVLGLFIFSVLRQQWRYRRLALAKIKAEISVLENERQRLAADLHDEVGPLLSAIKLQINHLDHASEHDKTLIEKSSRYIDEVIGKVREICNDLLPNILIRRGIAVAIGDVAQKLQESSGVQIEIDNQLKDRPLQSLEINMYRVLLEIMHNTVKHANAGKLRIQLAQDGNNLRLATEDDGKGFDMQKAMQGKGGHGLLNLQSRAEVMGAAFTFDSKPGKGTRYLFEIPHQA